MSAFLEALGLLALGVVLHAAFDRLFGWDFSVDKLALSVGFLALIIAISADKKP